MSTTTTTNSKSTTKNVNGKPAPKAAAAPPAPESKAAPKTPAAKEKASAKKDAKLAPAAKAQNKITYLLKRWTNLANIVGGWSPEVRVTVDEVGEAMLSAVAALAKLPADFTPPRKGGGGKADLAPESHVRISEKARAKYDGILEKDEIASVFTVVRVANGKVICTGPNGRVILPRGHVQLAAASKEDVAEDEA